jgi:hypothetical protein
MELEVTLVSEPKIVRVATSLAIATVFVRQGTKRVRHPPFLSPVVGLASSVTVDPSPPNSTGKVTDAILRTPSEL